uniref:Uncharacterized protein n=1 Tax=Rhizophora mucronata TaxID=61149 RepID=A0A2P2L4N8_RHIMU
MKKGVIGLMCLIDLLLREYPVPTLFGKWHCFVVTVI